MNFLNIAHSFKRFVFLEIDVITKTVPDLLVFISLNYSTTYKPNGQKAASCKTLKVILIYQMYIGGILILYKKREKRISRSKSLWYREIYSEITNSKISMNGSDVSTLINNFRCSKLIIKFNKIIFFF
jgi:hypothetical protein